MWRPVWRRPSTVNENADAAPEVSGRGGLNCAVHGIACRWAPGGDNPAVDVRGQGTQNTGPSSSVPSRDRPRPSRPIWGIVKPGDSCRRRCRAAAVSAEMLLDSSSGRKSEVPSSRRHLRSPTPPLSPSLGSTALLWSSEWRSSFEENPSSLRNRGDGSV